MKRKKSVGRKKAYVRTDTLWFKYIAIAMLFFLSGLGISYYFLDAGRIMGFFLQTVRLELEMKGMEKKLIEQKFLHEVKSDAYRIIELQLNEAQEENGKLQESLMFYEKIIGKKGK
mgnify:FL=1|tara:strand:+ start:166 stop:513 length:348 start_codon:yes stop_codon:yes gene_type:complete